MNDRIRTASREAFSLTQADFQGLADSLPICLLRKNCDGRPIFANRAYLKFHGQTLEQVLNRHPSGIFPQSDVEQFRLSDQEVMGSGEEIHDTYTFTAKDGEVCWLERIKGPVRNAEGAITGVQILFWDITERRQQEDSHNHERSLLLTLLDSIPDSIFFKDGESRFICISRSVAQLFGLRNREDAVGRSDADYFSEAYAGLTRADELEVMRTGEAIIGRLEKQALPGKSETLWSTTKMPLRDKDGLIIGSTLLPVLTAVQLGKMKKFGGIR